MTSEAKTKPVYPYDWSSIAKEVKDAHDWTCQDCGIKQGDNPRNNITVHHLDHNTFNSDASNLLVCCQICHLARERAYKVKLKADRLYNEFIASGQFILPGCEHLIFPQSNIAV